MKSYADKELHDIWKRTMDLFKSASSLDEMNFTSWFDNGSYIYDIKDQLVTVIVPYDFSKKVYELHQELITKSLSKVLGIDVKIQFLCNNDIVQNKVNNNFLEKTNKYFNYKLNPDYTFDNFIVGKNNREAQAAAIAACNYPGAFYNPIFIYGNSGLGKTHLLHSIINHVQQNTPDKRCLYIYSEDMVTLLIQSMYNKTVEEVKNQLYSYDFVLIDDIQRLKESSCQEIFFNMYNKLIADHKQIIITSDIHPTELKGIEKRLISRFSSGLTVTVGSPEFATARAILEKKIERNDDTVAISDEVLDYIATKFSSDVRKLEGALNDLLFASLFMDSDAYIDLKFAKNVFKDNPIILQDSELNAKMIKKAVGEYYGLTTTQLESKSRTKTISNARHIAVYLCRKHLAMPFIKIGFEFGNRDHSTIMSSYEKMKILLKENKQFQIAIQQIEEKLGIQ